jgi:hypothetical protein
MDSPHVTSEEQMSDNIVSDGIIACGALGIIFIILKLLEVINWSWWWILAPLWPCVILILAVVLAANIAKE